MSEKVSMAQQVTPVEPEKHRESWGRGLNLCTCGDPWPCSKGEPEKPQPPEERPPCTVCGYTEERTGEIIQSDGRHAHCALHVANGGRSRGEPVPAPEREESLEAIARAWFKAVGINASQLQSLMGALAAARAEGLQQGKREGLEEAAKVVREKCIVCGGDGEAGSEPPSECEYCGRPIAAIRSLQSPAEQGGE